MMKKQAGALLLLILLMAIPSTAQKPTGEMRGIAVEKRGEDLSEWGDGDSFEDIFDAVHIIASSHLKPSGSNRYEGAKAHDLDPKTAWVEGVPGDGIGESLQFTLTPQPSKNSDRAITGLTMFNGYRKNSTSWQENGRIKRLALQVNGKPYGMILLTDTMRYQTVNLGRIPLPHDGAIVLRFTIMSVYSGTKYHDTALSELEFVGTGIY